MASAGPVPALADRAALCADRLRDADEVLLASHIDADGLTSAAIASSALERAGIPFETVFSKQLDAEEVAAIAATDYETVLFTDFGSGQLDVISDHEAAGDFTPVIADHHQPADSDTEFHLNPLLFDVDGSSELSGAGAAYVLARALEPRGTDNRDLAGLAVVGAVGDMQTTDGELVGANQNIVAEGEEAGVVESRTDLAMYGKQTRPLPKMLEYSSDTRIPGITNNENGVLRFLDGLDVALKDDDGEWRCWVDLTESERSTVSNALIQRALSKGVAPDKIDRLVGTAYTLTDEPEGTELRDVSEFSTLLNATARYERADVGLAVCLGNRDGALDCARELLRNHRRNLSEGLQLVKREGVIREENVQWFHAEDRIRETIVGIVAGMAVGSEGIDRGTPIVAFAEKTDESDGDDESGANGDENQVTEVKVSARGTPALTRRGLDLSVVMREASQAVGGDGGGHNVAAGATVPKGTEEEFVALADELVGEQLG
ncbi:DHH family phosphoesterase [Halorussus gelatinilyticus]|uniref:DHH family phosphoesterase n=1 Tax=Halorussus gelatinilyticus TaxID=2937524 RepID=A0A8U0IP19_9EURY|nr:DHH family phosphoesterase [Halorussus gelatinilyticus]UPW01759.1 DHH family phosphoesterase [Halorussus gelatinilyticus]